MKIYVQTFTGAGKTYNFDVDGSITIQQLKRLLLEQTRDNDDLESIYFQFNEARFEDDKKTLSDYGIQDRSILQLGRLDASDRGDLGSIGSKFADLSNNKALNIKKWAETAPRWRHAARGLCLEGLCTSTKEECDAHGQSVIMPIGYKRFDILVDPNETTTVCPVCKKYVEPVTCSFNNCWWKFEGIKQDEVGRGKPPKKISSNWQQADDAYHYFDQQKSGMITWKQLIVEAVKDKPE